MLLDRPPGGAGVVRSEGFERSTRGAVLLPFGEWKVRTVSAAIEIAFQTVIGLEVHAQLLTRSKMYCGCSAAYADAEPNTHVCPVCLGLPGASRSSTAPRSNLHLDGFALHCAIPSFCKLDRKNYVYPDLPKGYQISSVRSAALRRRLAGFRVGRRLDRAGITRVHIEEDTGRLVHRSNRAGGEISLVDLNRSGVPLMEIVGEPDLTTPEEARDYLIALRQICVRSARLPAIWRKARSAVTRTSRLVRRTAHGRFEGRNQKHEQLPAVERALRFEEQRQRGNADRRANSDAGNARLGRGPGRDGVAAHQGTGARLPLFPGTGSTAAVVSDRATSLGRARLPELPASPRAIRDGLRALAHDAAVLSRIGPGRLLRDGDRRRCGYCTPAANWIANDLIGLQNERGLSGGDLPISAAQLRD